MAQKVKIDGLAEAVMKELTEYAGEAPNPPFICYLLPGSDNFSADGRVYYKINEVHIELYCDSKDPALEATLEAVLDEHGIFYNKTEVWIESEKLYEVLYTFEMEV